SSSEHEHVETGPSGHQGGDAVLAETFWRAAAGEDRVPRAGLVDGIDAALGAMALQDSARTGQAVEIEPLRAQVFGPEPVAGGRRPSRRPGARRPRTPRHRPTAPRMPPPRALRPPRAAGAACGAAWPRVGSCTCSPRPP